MKYITILESENSECRSVGTISTEDTLEKFKRAVESHFDAKFISYSFVDEPIKELDDCINAAPIDVLVTVDQDGEDREYQLELSQTWLY